MRNISIGKFVSDLRQVGGFLLVLRFSSTNKTDRHDINERLLKVALNTIKQTVVTFVINSINSHLEIIFSL